MILSFTSIPLVLYINWFQKKGNLDLDRGSLDIFKKIEKLEAAIGIANQKLREYANNLELMVNDRTSELESAMNELQHSNDELSEARDKLWSEMALAKKIQTTLIPENPALEDYEISTCLIPASEVGGDYYDVINGDNDWIVIGDVSGHGVSAGLIMMMVQSCLIMTK